MKHTRILSLTLIVCFAALLQSCESSTTTTPNGPTAITKAVFVLNEGAFNKKNASLDAYFNANDSVVHDLLPGLGDVGNDAELINGNLYLVMNNSGKIIVARPDTVKKLDSIAFSNGEAPNKIVQITATKAIVTQLYSDFASIVDLQSSKVTGAIPLGGGTNIGAAVLHNKAFISTGTKWIKVYDIGGNTVTDSIAVGITPQTVFVDSAHDQIAVLCWGTYAVTPGSIYWVNASTLKVIDSTHLGGGAFIQSLIMGRTYLYATIGDSIAAIDLATRHPNETFITGTSYYDGGFDVVNNELYLGKTGYGPNGTVDIFDASTGVKKRSFTAGIAPAHFAFYRRLQ